MRMYSPSRVHESVGIHAPPSIGTITSCGRGGIGGLSGRVAQADIITNISSAKIVLPPLHRIIPQPLDFCLALALLLLPLPLDPRREQALKQQGNSGEEPAHYLPAGWTANRSRMAET